MVCGKGALPAWSWHTAYRDVLRRPLTDTQVPNFDLRV